jgi:hypothetical protein
MTRDGEFSAQAARADLFWLAGLRLDPNTPHPDFYTLLRDDPAYWPIQHEGQIVFFHEAAAAPAVLAFALPELRLPPGALPTEPTLVLDIAQALWLLSTEPADESCCVLNLINALLDMLAAAALEPPARHRTALHRLADHLTFTPAFAPLLDGALKRTDTVESLQWALGAVMTKAMFFPKPAAGRASSAYN